MSRTLFNLTLVAALFGVVLSVPAATDTDTTSWSSIADGCGKTNKICLGVPKGCESKASECTALVSVQKIDSAITFRLKTTITNKYVAVGIGETNQMYNTSVIECVQEADQIKAYLSHTGETARSCLRDTDNGNVIKLVSSIAADAAFFCEVTRDAKSTVSGRTFDLDATKYFLQVAAGTAMKENPTGVGYHQKTGRSVSDDKYLLSGVQSNWQVHGSLLVFAWVLASTSGSLHL